MLLLFIFLVLRHIALLLARLMLARNCSLAWAWCIKALAVFCFVSKIISAFANQHLRKYMMPYNANDIQTRILLILVRKPLSFYPPIPHIGKLLLMFYILHRFCKIAFGFLTYWYIMKNVKWIDFFYIYLFNINIKKDSSCINITVINYIVLLPE